MKINKYELLQDIRTPWRHVDKGEIGDGLDCAYWFRLCYTEFFIRLDRGDYKKWLKKI